VSIGSPGPGRRERWDRLEGNSLEGDRLEGLLQSTLDQVEIGVYYLDRDYRFTFVNALGARYLRTPREDLLGKRLPDLFPEAWAGPFGTAYRRCQEDRATARARAFYEPFDTWFELTVFPTEEGLAADLRDVTEDQVRRRQLEETTERLRAQAELLNAARDAITLRGLDNRVEYWNRGAETVFGWTAAEAGGRSVRDLLFPDPEEFDRRTAEVLRKGHWTGDLMQQTRDGRVIEVDARWQLLRDGTGQPRAIFAVESDITGHRRAEEERYRTQRMESLGTLAGGMAHDLNNVLTPILMAAELLRDDEPDPGRRELVASIETAARRGADLIGRVLSFAKGEQGQRRVLAVETLLEDLGAFCREAMPKTINVDLQAARPLPPIRGDRTQLMQVLVNLVTNARDAMPDGGELTVRAGVRHSAPSAEAADDTTLIILSVEDSGVGMEQAIAARVFEPFFSTKGPGQGTGLGLSTSASIVKDHGGSLEVFSLPGRGSRFDILLPATTEEHEVAPPHARQPEVPRGNGELVLVADDEAGVRDAVRRALTAAGYRTAEAENGAVALVLAEDPEVAVVLVDMTMPVLGGAAVIDRLRMTRPQLPIIAMSGFDAEGIGVSLGRVGAVGFLAKPFSTPDLVAAVGERLNRGQSEVAE
jgi:two-component system cell cycle sensor histidine kinase/response regulator CckA